LEPHPVLKLAMEEAEKTITYAQVAENSPLANKSLKDLKIPEETGMWVLAIKRGEKCIRPKPDTKIQVSDILIASGYAEGEADLKKLAAP
jgi:uncharacterized protein with PhoU and TrkA domain